MLLLAADPAAAQVSEAPEPSDRLTVEAGVGQRSASLRWNVGQNRGTIRSELTYSDVAIREAFVGATVALWTDAPWLWMLSVEARLGQVADGTARDSDYRGADRTREYSRSLSDVTGTIAHSQSVALALRRHPDHPWAADLELLLGLRHSRQTMRMQNGVSILPYESVLEGLDSRYTSSWVGPWMAVGAGETRGPLRISGRLAVHLGQQYSGEGQWNLRDDLEQPVSFDQSGEGYGLEARVRGAYTLATGATVSVEGQWLHQRLRRGEDRLHVAEQPRPAPGGVPYPPVTLVAQLHEVVWSTLGVQLGLSLDF